MFRVIKREPGVIVFMLLEDNALEFWVCLTLCSIYCPYINLEKLQKFQCFICGQVKSDPRRVCQDKPAVAYACSVPFNNCVHSYSLLLRCICVIRLKPFVWSKTTNRSEEHTSELQSPVHLVC